MSNDSRFEPNLCGQPDIFSAYENINDLCPISVFNLSKTFRLYDSSMHRLKEALHPLRKKYHHDFWALRRVSFEIKKGEIVGLIGRNGSGKSTLLHIISGTLAPSEGKIKVNGRVSALLELGAGFNPELTGKENVYMNGAIEGLSRQEVDDKFQAIADFAEIGDFMDQPIKTYSSGMYVRLAFAVAVNIDPEILIIDEALSVGDVRFTQKCMRKMDEFREQKKTILLVSHDMGAIKNFCNRVIWINDGQIYKMGNPKEITKLYSNYMHYGTIPSVVDFDEKFEQQNAATARMSQSIVTDPAILWDDVSKCSQLGNGGVAIRRVSLYELSTFSKTVMLEGGERVNFLVEVDIIEDVMMPIIAVDVKNELGNLIFGMNNCLMELALPEYKKTTTVVFQFEFKMPLLKNGKYSISVGMADGTYNNNIELHIVHDAYVFDIASKELSARHYYVTIEDTKLTFKSSS